ncbi:MAG: hypothetical protein COA70_01460 [Planctomycetota bacterium]|nr:MAG: hypothetical protein COA70_01460 [Planctomycetota bacterium]
MENRPSKLETYRDQEIAATYDQRWSSARGKKRDARKAKALQRAVDAVLQARGMQAKTLLDIPCGTGRFSDLWQAHGFQVLGADLAVTMLQEARAKHPQATFFAADLAHLPFADGGLDLGICIRFLHLVRDPKLRIAFLRELKRVCKVGAVIDYRHAHTFRIWSRRLRFRLGKRARPPANPTFSQIRAELDAAGWDSVQWIHVRRHPWLSDKLLIAAVPRADAVQ